MLTVYNSTVGIAGAEVYIVNPSDTSQYYWRGMTNAQGYFQVSYVNNTYVDSNWIAANGYTPDGYSGPGYYPLYRIYSFDLVYGEAYSNNFTVESNGTATLSAIHMPSLSGGALGRVITSDTIVGIAGAYVAVVDTNNPSHVYSAGWTNAQGFFEFTGLEDTWVDADWIAEPGCPFDCGRRRKHFHSRVEREE
jgi:hypothetical protein